MKPNHIFVAHHCENSSPYIEQSLKEKNYVITKKNCDGIKVLRYVLREKPDICILKSSYSDLLGLDIIKQAHLKKSKSKFILVFNEVSEIDIVMAKKFNVSGCLSCNDSKEEVLACLDKVHNNKRYFSKEILEKIDNNQIENYTNFTDFQMKVIAYIGFYNSPDKLANKLNVAISTVRKEVDLIKNQLRLTCDQPLHLWAVKNTSFIETLVLSESS